MADAPKRKNGKKRAKNGKQGASKAVVRGSLAPVKRTILKHPHNSEVRDACGFEGRVLSDLTQDDIKELCSVYLMDGPDALRTKYGLTHGEVVDLCCEPSFAAIIGVLAGAQRTQVVVRASFTLGRALVALEQRILDPETDTDAIIRGIDRVANLIKEIGGIEQNINVRHTHSIPGSEEVIRELRPDELGKLQRLHDTLEACALADVDLSVGVKNYGKSDHRAK